MEPLLFVGAVGATFIGVGLLENLDLKINTGAIKLVLECAKYGSILYLLKVVYTLFI